MLFSAACVLLCPQFVYYKRINYGQTSRTDQEYLRIEFKNRKQVLISSVVTGWKK